MKTKKFHFPIKNVALILALTLAIGAVLGGVFFSVPSRAADTSNLGQIVDHFTANSSVTFKLTDKSRFYLLTEPTGDLLQTIQLSQRQFATDGIPSANPMPIVYFTNESMLRPGDILIKLVDNDSDIGTEGYKLNVSAYTTVTAEDVNGLLYGLNMLQKHFRAAGSAEIKGFYCYDTPDTKERTVQLDCARKYLSAEYICNFVKEMSWMGYNSLQLHFSEDGGFRADFWNDNYYVDGKYEPENDLTWLCGSQVQSWVKDESNNGGKNYRIDPDANSYLTTKDLIEIINTCKEYHIDIIPSFDSPAHMDYLTWKFERNYRSNNNYAFTYNGTTYKASDTKGCINYTGTTGAATPSWPDYTTMDLSDTTRGRMSKAFIFTLYKDIADFFRYYAGSTKFNIGADEVNLTASSNISWNYSKFPGYINELTALLESRDYTVRMFNDFINDNNVDDFDSDIEILYWNSPFNTTNTSKPYNEPSVSSFVNDSRILYNCINIHTYYVLRVPVKVADDDARSVYCRSWEFYAADEKSIYERWAPNNIRKWGDAKEPDAIVPNAQLGGAYFLFWHDYAAVNTENEIWNGVKDTLTNTGETYSARNRMWSNSVKMWNWDLDKTLSFANFELIRNALGDFPGLQNNTFDRSTSHAKATSLSVAATAPIQLADHTALTQALANRIDQGEYNDQSYAAYLQAYTEAQQVNARDNASAEELGNALAKLQNAINNLKIRTNTFTVERKTIINGVTVLIDSIVYEFHHAETSYNIFIPSLTGYNYIRTDNSNFDALAAGDGSGYLTGTAYSDMVITMWYDHATDLGRLNALLANRITEQGDFTDESWAVYTQALNAASKFTLSSTTMQSDVDKLVKALEDARTALIIPSDETFIKVELISPSISTGEQVGLYVSTSTNVPTLTITNKSTGEHVELDVCTAEIQTLNDGTVVKRWVILFPADFSGSVTFIVSYNLTFVEI